MCLQCYMTQIICWYTRQALFTKALIKSRSLPTQLCHASRVLRTLHLRKYANATISRMVTTVRKDKTQEAIRKKLHHTNVFHACAIASSFTFQHTQCILGECTLLQHRLNINNYEKLMALLKNFTCDYIEKILKHSCKGKKSGTNFTTWRCYHSRFIV